MAITLLSIAIVLLLAAAMPEAAVVRDFDLFARYTRWMDRVLRPNGFWNTAAAPLCIIAPIFLLMMALQHALADFAFGIFGFGLGMVVLYFSLGPRDLGDDLDNLAHAHLPEQRIAAQAAFGLESGTAYTSAHLIEPIFAAALKRKFAPVFWFAIFGGAGALCYRLAQLLADDKTINADVSDALKRNAAHVDAALAWIPAQLMCAALALASDFDAVARAWRDHHDSHGRGILDLDLGFLSNTAKACIDIDDVDELTDAQTPIDNAPIHHARQLLGRITITWLLGLATLVLAAYLA
jgi:AmpE protein